MFKNLRKNKGITLIALIITIIVLLILAGVTISVIVGNESSMEKAKLAKEENEKGNEFDLIKLAVTDAMSKGDDGSIKLTNLNSSLSGLVIENATGNSPWTVTGNTGNKYRIKNNGEVKLKTSNVLDTIQIGDTINYSTTFNNALLENWRAFYIDDDYIYIISNEYLPYSAVQNIDGVVQGNSSTSGNYAVKGSSRDDLINAMTKKSNWSGLLIGILNGNSIDYSTSSDTNIKAMGGPTLDVYVNSWNKQYPNSKIFIATNENGYYVGSSENPTTFNVGEPNSDSLYCPYTNSFASCNGYWLASPSAKNTSNLMSIGHSGSVSYYGYTGTDRAFRPIICLPSSAFE